MSGETGGCQCGAVRFRVTGSLGRPSICHCRMCQKAFGAPYGALVSVKIAELEWTRGARKRFASSNKVERGFCGDCGTPLTFEWSDKVIDLAIAAFDDPAPIAPVVQMALDSALPWTAGTADLPTPPATHQAQMQAHYEAVVSRQHPDHDTETWPPAP
ncbi:GFA family protein [Phenylobacterium sp. LH3H17]|uniref:GFA family protein n=1 Tax=Phenylobacterium sp. LH3H17 TaxID=2903901 RepID=UPI0020C95E7E|nr:GFA family protein [Phenylobacterium sp. LH3H17]UTP39480.1 GFA family protein [Phenylobacterium sp. LH3H17]